MNYLCIYLAKIKGVYKPLPKYSPDKIIVNLQQFVTKRVKIAVLSLKGIATIVQKLCMIYCLEMRKVGPFLKFAHNFYLHLRHTPQDLVKYTMVREHLGGFYMIIRRPKGCT